MPKRRRPILPETTNRLNPAEPGPADILAEFSAAMREYRFVAFMDRWFAPDLSYRAADGSERKGREDCLQATASWFVGFEQLRFTILTTGLLPDGFEALIEWQEFHPASGDTWTSRINARYFVLGGLIRRAEFDPREVLIAGRNGVVNSGLHLLGRRFRFEKQPGV